MSPSPFHYPSSPSNYYPFSSTPFGYGSPLPWGYPAAPPQTPHPSVATPSINIPQVSPPPGPPQIAPAPAALSSFPATQDLKLWCMQHALGEGEYDGLIKLGFRVGEGHELANLEKPMWEWAGITPLARVRILAACQTTDSESSVPTAA